MYVPNIDLDTAKAAIAAAEEKATAIGVKATTVVLDNGGDLVAMSRMNGAWPGGFDLAIGKARTSRSFHAPSSAFVPMIQPGSPLFSVNSVSGGMFVILGGGIPIETEGHVAGAVGVSGGTTEQDVAIAIAALEACNFPNERKIS